ncbi:hypothetical protein HYU82_03385 [Candidatus Saccharibacteria bacterium]|nr:hypothetical protein [Candidatus Saccharibacteria bacterium]
MVDKYVYRRLVRRHWYGKFRLRRRFVVLFIILLAVLVAIVTIDLLRGDAPKTETSAVRNFTVSDDINTFQTNYFSFQDSGKWVFNKQESTPTKFVYHKFRGVQPQHQLTIYVNEEPIPLYLAVSRVIPVRIVNNNTLDITNIYGPCGSTYKSGELHKVKIVTIEGANMLCDPDTPQYSVVLAEVNGDWRLEMEREDGTLVTFVITFRDLTLDPGPDSILRIAESFKAR